MTTQVIGSNFFRENNFWTKVNANPHNLSVSRQDLVREVGDVLLNSISEAILFSMTPLPNDITN